MQGANHNDEPLKPHTDIHENGENPNKNHVISKLLNPKELRCDNITRNHDPVGPPVRPERSILKTIGFVRVTSIPSDEKLHSIGVANNSTGSENDFTHQIDMTLGKQIMKIENGP